MMQITIQDRQSYVITHREFTDEGFLRVPGKVARTGIQQYLARELGLDGDPNRIINVYRPDEEVFNTDSLASYDGVDVTIEHPDGLVNSQNYKKVSCGVVRGAGIRTDDNFVQCNLVVKDKSAVDAVMNGKCELSAGYTAVYDDTPGVTPDGQDYHFMQRSIRINHVAIVDRARAGGLARIFDNTPTGGNPMPVNITLDSGRVIDVADAANAQVVADAFDRAEKRVKDAEAAKDKLQAQLDSVNEKLTKALQDSGEDALKSRVEAIAKCQTKARKVAGDSFTCDSVNPVEIMRAALTVKRPKTDFSDKSPDYISAAFDMAAEEEEEEEKKLKDSAEQISQLSKDAAGANNTVTTDSRVQKLKHNIANAWKGQGA